MRMRALIVIPAYNEASALPALLAELRAAAASVPHALEVLVVDDASTDETAAVAKAHGARCVRLSSNLGIGGAVQAGLRVAHREGFDCAVQVDGDGQHNPVSIAALLEALTAAPAPDLVVGSRFLAEGGWRTSTARRFGIGWLSFVLRFFCGVRSSDPTSGFRAFGPRALRLFSRTFPYDFPEPESLTLAQRAHLRIAEVPVDMRARTSGESSINGFVPLYYMLKVTLAVLLSRIRNARLPLA